MFLALLLLLASPVRADDGTFGPQSLDNYCATMSAVAASFRADYNRYEAEIAECLNDPHCDSVELEVLRILSDSAHAMWINTRQEMQRVGCTL